MNVKLNYNSTIYPNPSSTKLYFNVKLDVYTITVLDLTGKVVKTINPKSNYVNVAELVNGIYFVRLLNNDGAITEKFIKN